MNTVNGVGMCSEYGHSWIAGLCCVSDEDVAEVARMRTEAGETLPWCERCDVQYGL